MIAFKSAVSGFCDSAGFCFGSSVMTSAEIFGGSSSSSGPDSAISNSLSADSLSRIAETGSSSFFF